MAAKKEYAALLVEAMLYALYFALAGKKSERPFPQQAGLTYLLSTVGLRLIQRDSGFDIENDSGETVVRISLIEIGSALNIYVEPAVLVLRAFELIDQPITYISKKEVY